MRAPPARAVTRTVVSAASRAGRSRPRRLGFSARTYLDHARHALAEASDPADPPAMRYVAAHLAALRCAAAVLAVRGRPAGRHRGTAWTELVQVAPELGEWADLFAAGAELRAAVETGVSVSITECDVEALSRDGEEFLAVVERLVGLEVQERQERQEVLPRAS